MQLQVKILLENSQADKSKSVIKEQGQNTGKGSTEQQITILSGK